MIGWQGCTQMGVSPGVHFCFGVFSVVVVEDQSGRGVCMFFARWRGVIVFTIGVWGPFHRVPFKPFRQIPTYGWARALWLSWLRMNREAACACFCTPVGR